MTDSSVEEQQQQMANILVQNQSLQTQLNTVNSHLASLQQLLQSIQSNTNHNASQPTTSTSTTTSNTVPSGRRQNRRATIPPTHYCWSHGGTINPAHTSSTCCARKPGHDPTATLQDTKGGSQKFLDLLSRGSS